ncbi:MAG TPA: ImmA/IrrE family metallo-endopeptidase [Allosphingosinicella sp.]|jgi:HTH-type transcriptional regulator/antitoxin HigA
MKEFTPAEVFPPGEYLMDELEARGWTQAEFAEIIRRPARLVSEVVAGKRAITPETARDFSAALGTSAQFWLGLEATYQSSRLAPADEAIAREAQLRERFPVRELIKRGWIEGSKSLDVLEARILKFFDIPSIEAPVALAHAAKRSGGTDISMLQIAWLRRVLNLAKVPVQSAYSADRLRAILGDLEALMGEPEGIRHVPRILNSCGVRFVIVEPIAGSKIDGACLWLDDKSPVVALSLRLDRIDNFWFVLRHEIEHILRGDGKDTPIVDNTEEEDTELECEIAANAAAANFCVPQTKIADFIARIDPFFSDERVRGFAKLVRRHTGIVVGQLRRRTGRNNLFAKYLVKVRHHIVPVALTDGYGVSLSD